jgi:Ca2+-dependent lipid-binding protein
MHATCFGTEPPLPARTDCGAYVLSGAGYSKSKTLGLKFADLSAVVKEYDQFEEAGIATRVERDHVIEVQLINHIWESKMDGRRTTRQAALPVKNVINSEVNLNNTTHVMNFKKRDAVTEFIKQYDAHGVGLREALLAHGVKPATTRKVCTAVESVATAVADSVQDQGSSATHDSFAEELATLVGHMQLE